MTSSTRFRAAQPRYSVIVYKLFIKKLFPVRELYSSHQLSAWSKRASACASRKRVIVMSGEGSSAVPLSSEAQDAKEMVHQQLMRKMANKMMSEAIEEERQRRMKESEAGEGAERQKAYNQLIVVQEDLVRTINLMRVRAHCRWFN